MVHNNSNNIAMSYKVSQQYKLFFQIIRFLSFFLLFCFFATKESVKVDLLESTNRYQCCQSKLLFSEAALG